MNSMESMDFPGHCPEFPWSPAKIHGKSPGSLDSLQTGGIIFKASSSVLIKFNMHNCFDRGLTSEDFEAEWFKTLVAIATKISH